MPDTPTDILPDDLSRFRTFMAAATEPDPDSDTNTHTPEPLTGLPRILDSAQSRRDLLPNVLRRLDLPPDLLDHCHTPMVAWRIIHQAILKAGYDPATWLPLDTPAIDTGGGHLSLPKPTRAGHDRAMATARRHLTENDDLFWDSMPPGTTRDAVWQTVHRLRAVGWLIDTRYALGYHVEHRGV